MTLRCVDIAINGSLVQNHEGDSFSREYEISESIAAHNLNARWYDHRSILILTAGNLTDRMADREQFVAR